MLKIRDQMVGMGRESTYEEDIVLFMTMQSY